MRQTIQGTFGPLSNENRIMVQKMDSIVVFSLKLDALPLGKKSIRFDY
jgi:hypothetical protein